MKKIFIAACICFSILGCTDHDLSDSGNYTEQETDNIWIYKQMKTYYLWSDEIPDQVNTTLSLPQTSYFASLLHRYENEKHKVFFSSISEKTSDSKADDAPDADKTYESGFGFTGRIISVLADNPYTALQILYVIPGSPADLAGIDRGDLFTKYNGTSIASGSLSVINSLSKVNLTKWDIMNEDEGETISLEASTYKNTPIIKSKVIGTTVSDEIIIGYLAYNEFSYGSSYCFLNELKDVFRKFKAYNISDLVLDLRYNPGGYVSVATTLASMIAPKNSVESKDVFIIQEYNDTYAAQLKKNDTEYDITRFSLTDEELSGCNIDLSSIHIITQSYTASASELVIHALKPYMEVHQYGLTTYGKNLGSVQISSSSVNWILQPIVSRVYDKNNVSGYENGISPTTGGEVNSDDSALLYPFGDYNEILLGMALENIISLRSKSPVFVKENYETIPIEVLEDVVFENRGVIN
ncbi:MAG: hypothetical protein LIO79_08585 [Rikenellaceae bacterium]|nr:hypothetical protein [Rikenellaceae bacterium]